MDNGHNGHNEDDWRYVDGATGGHTESVRILPEPDEAEDALPNEQQPIQRGTLYAPAPPPPAYSHAPMQPYEPQSGRQVAMQPVVKQQAEMIEPKQASAGQENQGPAAKQVKRGPSACSIIAATFGVLALSCALLAFATFKGGLDNLGKLGGIFPNFGLVTTPTVTINTGPPPVLSQVKALSKLETVDYQLDKVVSGKSSGPLPDIFTSDKILLVAHGEVVGGVDLSHITQSDIEVITDTVVMTMPKAEVLYSKLDNDKTFVYDRETGIFTKPDPNLETQLRQVAEQQILQGALEDGILDQARTNAEQVLRSLITGLGYKEVEFRQSP